MKYTREGHYQIACKVYFDATHSGADDQDVHINHPNQYFDESQLFYSGKKEGRLQICNSGQMYLELWIQNALGKTSICYNYALESQDPKPHLNIFLQGKYPTPQLGQEVKDQVRAHNCHRLPRIHSQFPRMQQWMMKWWTMIYVWLQWKQPKWNLRIMKSFKFYLFPIKSHNWFKCVFKYMKIENLVHVPWYSARWS